MQIRLAYNKYSEMIKDNQERFEKYFGKKLSVYMNRIVGFKPKKFAKDSYFRYFSDDDLILKVLEKYGQEAADLLQVLMERK